MSSATTTRNWSKKLTAGKNISTLTVYNGPEIKSWFLSWGKQVEVLEPQGLQEETKKELHDWLRKVCVMRITFTLKEM